MAKSYKKEFSFEKRRSEASRIRAKHMDYIPVIVEQGKNISNTIDKRKFLVPANFTVGQFVYVVRRRIKMEAEKAIFIFVGNTIPQVSQNISEIYKQYKDEDGFLYITYSGENTFG